MKFMIQIIDNPDTRNAFFGEAGSDLMAEVDALMAELTESGELVGGEALQDPAASRTVRVRDGVTAVEEGPVHPADSHVGGFLLVDCPSLDRATEIAARWPNSRFCAMEVRPVMAMDPA